MTDSSNEHQRTLPVTWCNVALSGPTPESQVADFKPPWTSVYPQVSLRLRKKTRMATKKERMISGTKYPFNTP
jgi:hypothetical protein